MVLIRRGSFALFTHVAGNEEKCIMGDVVTVIFVLLHFFFLTFSENLQII